MNTADAGAGQMGSDYVVLHLRRVPAYRLEEGSNQNQQSP